MFISVQWILQSNVDLNSFKVFVFIQKDKMDTNYLLSKVTKNDNKAEIFMFKKNRDMDIKLLEIKTVWDEN